MVTDFRYAALLLAGSALLGWPFARGLSWVLRALGLERTNFEGSPVRTGGGLLFLLAALPWLYIADPRARLPALAACGFGLLGFIDDRWGTSEFKGLRGHLGALRKGRVTTGQIKALGGAVLAVVLALQIHPGWPALLAAALMALAANLFNLLDLRPLRALKLFWILAAPLLLFAPGLLWQTVGLSAPYAAQEARRTVMLGDTGANLLGGVLGVTAAAVLPAWAQVVVVGTLLAFHAWAEHNSLSRWIDASAWASALDRWGWSDRPHAGEAGGADLRNTNVR